MFQFLIANVWYFFDSEVDNLEDDITITFRVLKRANQVLGMVMKHKVVSDFSHILKVFRFK
jgi:hypothetical protein